MIVKKRVSKRYTIFEINFPTSIQGFHSNESGISTFTKQKGGPVFFDEKEKIEFNFHASSNSIIIKKEFFNDEHILGLGEKAFHLDRRRLSLKMWNTDNYGYQWHTDPLYISIPFFISIRKGIAK